MKVQYCKSHGELNMNAGSGSSGCISVRSNRSAAAAAFRECEASGSASAARTSGPCAILTFRLRGGLPRGVAVLGDRRLGLSGIEIPHRCSLFGKPELAAGGNCSGLDSAAACLA